MWDGTEEKDGQMGEGLGGGGEVLLKDIGLYKY